MKTQTDSVNPEHSAKSETCRNIARSMVNRLVDNQHTATLRDYPDLACCDSRQEIIRIASKTTASLTVKRRILLWLYTVVIGLVVVLAAFLGLS